MSDLVRFGVSLERDLLEEFDELCRRRGYANRSEALRHCLRRELAEEDLRDPLAPAAGVLAVIYDHHESDLPRRLTAMQHDAHDAVLATMHVHLSHHYCLEVMALSGPSGEVRDLADRLRSARGILHGALSLAVVPHDDSHGAS